MLKSRVKATYAHRWTSPAAARRRARRRAAFAGALVHLGMLPAPGRLAVHTVAVWLATVLGICGYLCAVLALAA